MLVVSKVIMLPLMIYCENDLMTLFKDNYGGVQTPCGADRGTPSVTIRRVLGEGVWCGQNRLISL